MRSNSLDGEGDGHCCRIESVMHVMTVMRMLMDIVIRVKL